MKKICLLLSYFWLGVLVGQLPPPTNIRGTKLVTNRIDVSWEWDARLCSSAVFEIRWSLNPTGGNWQIFQRQIQGNRFRHTEVRHDTHYYYSIRVICPNGFRSSWSQLDDFGIAWETEPRATITPTNVLVYGAHPTPNTHKAFVIGNRDYESLDTMLGADVSARGVSDLLRGYNWGVTGSENLRMKQSFENEINRFLQTVQPNDTILLYYAGYGIRYRGTNYLLPKRTQLKTASDVLTQGYCLDTLLQKMGRTRTATVILLEIALPNTPFGDFEPVQLSAYDNELVIVRHNKVLWNQLLPFTGRFLQELSNKPCVSIGSLVEKLQLELDNVTYFNKFVRPFALRGCD